MTDRFAPAPWWVTFDCFGTLVDWNTGFRRLIEPLAGERTEEVIRRYHVQERALEARRPFRKYRDVLTQALSKAAKDAGVALSLEQARVLPERWGRLPVFSDVEPMLAALRSAGYRLGVLTNCDEDLFACTERSFVQPFDEVVTAQAVCSYKPALAHFHRFEEETGARRSHWVHVACSWYHDIAPAQEFGIARIWLDREQTADDSSAATIRVETATDVPPAVARIASVIGSPTGVD